MIITPDQSNCVTLIGMVTYCHWYCRHASMVVIYHDWCKPTSKLPIITKSYNNQSVRGKSKNWNYAVSFSSVTWNDLRAQKSAIPQKVGTLGQFPYVVDNSLFVCLYCCLETWQWMQYNNNINIIFSNARRNLPHRWMWDDLVYYTYTVTQPTMQGIMVTQSPTTISTTTPKYPSSMVHDGIP
jgi:hypothetical protein